jgi:hypothetical protein
MPLWLTGPACHLRQRKQFRYRVPGHTAASRPFTGKIQPVNIPNIKLGRITREVLHYFTRHLYMALLPNSIYI